MEKDETMSKPTKIWMLYVEGHSAPTCQHYNPISADHEAIRLCEITGKRVYVLEAIRAIEPKVITKSTADFDTIIKWNSSYERDNIPF